MACIEWIICRKAKPKFPFLALLQRGSMIIWLLQWFLLWSRVAGKPIGASIAQSSSRNGAAHSLWLVLSSPLEMNVGNDWRIRRVDKTKTAASSSSSFSTVASSQPPTIMLIRREAPSLKSGANQMTFQLKEVIVDGRRRVEPVESYWMTWYYM